MQTSMPDSLPAVVSFTDAITAFGFSRATGERLVRDRHSDFPRPFRIGGERYFRVDDLRAWINRKAAEANADQAA